MSRLTNLTVRLSTVQLLMLDRLVEHSGRVLGDQLPGMAPPTRTDILRQCLHIEHARVFGYEEHDQVLEVES